MYFPEESSYEPESTAHVCKESCKCPDFYRQFILSNGMRLAWLQHVYWTRLVLISIAERLPDQAATVARLMQNPRDIAKNFEPYFSADFVRKITQLLTEHLQIGGDLITALRDEKSAEAADLNRRWYANADKMSEAFAATSPNYKHSEVRDMFYRHLELTTAEVNARLAKKYADDIAAFAKVEREALMMADYQKYPSIQALYLLSL